MEQTANELEEPVGEIAQFYDLLQKHYEKTDEEIYSLYEKSKAMYHN